LLALIGLCFLRPAVGGNEAQYLPGGRRILEPAFLANDWAFATGPWYGSLNIAFDLVASGLWALAGDATAVALVGRVLAWSLVVAALTRLAKTTGVHPGFLIAGAAGWLIGGQGFAAREWIFGGVEQKVFAYAALFAALDAACRGRVLRAGVFSGVAIAFHVLVGGWGGAALGLGILIRYRSVRESLRFGLPALLLATPVMLNAVSFIFMSSPEASADSEAVNRLAVMFRNPHHLDPDSFLHPFRAWVFVLMLMSAGWAVSQIASRDAARILIPFLGGAAVLWLAGIAAGTTGALGFLKFYPFRVADVAVPLFFWLAVPQAVFERARSLGPGTLARRTVVPAILATAVLGVVAFEAQREFRRDFVRGVTDTLSAWKETPCDPFREASEWIRDHTPAGSIIATFPCRKTFWVEAERAMVVNFKSTPVNAEILEWYERLIAMNRGLPFEKRGFRACKELARNYKALPPVQLRRLRAEYGADFYLVEGDRPDLAEALLYANEELSLYDLGMVESE